MSSPLGALGNGAGDSISYGQIATASAVNTTATILAHPALADGAITSVTLTPVGKIVNQDAKWTYTYKNQNVVAPGGSVALATDERDSGRDECHFLKLDGFALPMHKTARQKTA